MSDACQPAGPSSRDDQPTREATVPREATSTIVSDLLRDRDVAEATYEIVRVLAIGLVIVFLAFTVYHATADPHPSARSVIAIDQVVLLLSAVVFVLMLRRKIPLHWAHASAVLLGLMVAADTAATALLQGQGNDLNYMQAVILGGGALLVSHRALALLLSGTVVMGLSAAFVVCNRESFIYFVTMQSTTAMVSIALYYTRLVSQKKLLRLRRHAASVTEDLGRALARAEQAISEHRRSDEKRRELEEQLRRAQKLEALGTLAGGVAHDMNNVLGAITAIASAALDTQSQGSDARQDMIDILETAHRGETLTRNILSFARRERTHSAPFCLDAVVREVDTMLRRTLPKHVVLTVDCQAPDSWVNGEAGQIGHLLTNLCLNSADAIEQQGHISVSTRPTVLDAQRASQFGTTPGPYVQLTVSDDGRGIPPEVLPRVLDPYFSTKTDHKHAGLGLAMVYGTVQQHRGGIKIQSTVGQGTRIAVVLPALEQLSTQSSPSPPQALRVDPERNRLLFVDDEPMLRRSGKRIAQHLGFDVLLACDGREALDVFSQNRAKVGAVVLDIAMPVMSGAECCRMLHEMDPTLPIVLVSGFPKDHDIQTLLANPHTCYVRKPYDKRDLEEALASAGLSQSGQSTLPEA
jgi:signal transduction histidine kinase/CheY-like chemotaxis protein